MIATQPHAAANPGRPPRHRPPCHRPPHASPLATAAAGFTLIEVLISIIILALGLLGIGVVFPVVIRQQRISTDEVAGVLAARNTADQLLTRTSGDAVWENWRRQIRNDVMPPPDAYLRGEWQLPIYGDAGELRLGPAVSTVGPAIALRDMLLFSSQSRSDGVYAWDVAVQAVYDGESALADSSDDHLRVAMFIRRIDARTLDQMSRRPDVLAFAVDSASGLPTIDRGQSGLEYAQPVVMQTRVVELPNGNEVDRDHFVWNRVNISDEKWAIVSQVGQKIVDSFGNVYTVQRGFIDDDGYQRVRITPPIPASITFEMVRNTLVVSIVTTPQPAVAVYTFEVTP